MFCSKCGSEALDQADFCMKCGAQLRLGLHPDYVPKRLEDDPAVRMLLPVGRSGLSIVAGYLGLFAVLLFPAPLALLFGILALRDIDRNPEKYGNGRAMFGVVMGALGTIGLILLGIGTVTGR